MDPIVTVLRVGDVERIIGSYGVMLALCALVGGGLAARAAARARMDVGAVIAVVGFIVAGAVIGGFSLFVAVEWARLGSPLSALESPGLVFWGAPAGGGLAFFLTAKPLGLDRGRFVDVALPALPAAHAIGRLGCFLGGCCYGKPWDGAWSVVATHVMAPAAHPAIPRHPVALYESLGLFLLALVFALVPPRVVGRGLRLALYLALYALLRLGVELFRGDAVRGIFIAGLSTSQILSTLVLAGALGLVWMSRRVRA